MIVVTGATGQLGRLVVQELLRTVEAKNIVAAVRDTAKAADLKALGVQVREADYTRPQTLDAAFDGAEKLLLVSSNALGQRVAQHRAVIESAMRNQVKLIGYTSVLRADTSELSVALEHRETEDLLAASGIPFVLLRNGWYSENYTGSVPVAVAHGVVMGAAGEGRISAASRLDYAAAAAAAMTKEEQGGKVYELAGDKGFTLAEFAAEIAKQSGKPVRFQNLLQTDYKAALLGFGLPEPVADLVSQSDAKAADGALFDEGGALGKLIGRPTTPIAESIAAALKG